MIKRKWYWCALLFVCSLLLGTASLFAQTASTGALVGTVTDSSGAALPGATVTVTSADTAQTRTVMSGSDGTYKIGLLSPGVYKVRFEAGGFEARRNSVGDRQRHGNVSARSHDGSRCSNPDHHRRRIGRGHSDRQFRTGHGRNLPNRHRTSAEHS